jgi:hypothetical protein
MRTRICGNCGYHNHDELADACPRCRTVAPVPGKEKPVKPVAARKGGRFVKKEHA